MEVSKVKQDFKPLILDKFWSRMQTVQIIVLFLTKYKRTSHIVKVTTSCVFLKYISRNETHTKFYFPISVSKSWIQCRKLLVVRVGSSSLCCDDMNCHPWQLGLSLVPSHFPPTLWLDPLLAMVTAVQLYWDLVYYLLFIANYSPAQLSRTIYSI